MKQRIWPSSLLRVPCPLSTFRVSCPQVFPIPRLPHQIKGLLRAGIHSPPLVSIVLEVTVSKQRLPAANDSLNPHVFQGELGKCWHRCMYGAHVQNGVNETELCTLVSFTAKPSRTSGTNVKVNEKAPIFGTGAFASLKGAQQSPTTDNRMSCEPHWNNAKHIASKNRGFHQWAWNASIR